MVVQRYVCFINFQVFLCVVFANSALFLTHINEIWQIDRTYSLYSEINGLPFAAAAGCLPYEPRRWITALCHPDFAK